MLLPEVDCFKIRYDLLPWQYKTLEVNSAMQPKFIPFGSLQNAAGERRSFDADSSKQVACRFTGLSQK